jgi:hypothetical protein
MPTIARLVQTRIIQTVARSATAQIKLRCKSAWTCNGRCKILCGCIDGGTSLTSNVFVLRSAVIFLPMMSVDRLLITQARAYLSRKKSCSSWEEELPEIERSMEQIFGCLIPASFMMKSLISYLKIGHIHIGIVAKNSCLTFGDITSGEKFGLISKLDNNKMPIWSHHMQGMAIQGPM